MPLDQFKTQVLLLHSEQSTLDHLKTGFSDNYTVHCATSGSEALNTLVETPINVIVTAQNLPGMSGLDALREAKKRSPDTIGILIAGSADVGLEALVGDEEVFQVVRGNVTAESLRVLVDNATRQIRLMALAESANDTAANVDRPVTEHIIMETSKDGSMIISDGTDRMPALDPKKVSTATSVGSHAVDVLVLTKDEEFLETIKKSSRGMHQVHYANTLPQADDAIRKYKIGVAVVDSAMVGDKVEQLTQHLRKGAPRLVSIVAGRRDDGDMLMDLINRGKVYRFLLKPVSPGRARLAIESSVRHHLEAPSAAFKTRGTAAVASPLARAESKPAPAPKATARTKQSAATSPITAADPPLGSRADADTDSPFMASVTGLAESVSKKLSGLTAPPKLLGLGAIAVVAIGAALFWFQGDTDETPAAAETQLRATSITETEFIPDAPATVVDVDALLQEARLAQAAGQIFNPVGSNAIELFVAALHEVPEDANVAAELDALLAQALGMAESALLESRLDDADAALQRIAMAEADNARLPFLTAQLSQMKLRSYVDQARAATRENRFEDAAVVLVAARGLSVADDSEIRAVARELNSARSAQQVDDVLAKAHARLEQGDLLSPANNNARYYYELVLSADPGNTSARQGLHIIASKLVLQARAKIDGGDLGGAENTLSDALAIDSANSEIAAAVTALAISRAELAAQQRHEEAERVAAELAAVESAAAERLAVESAAAERLATDSTAVAEQAATEPAAEVIIDAAAEPEAGAPEPEPMALAEQTVEKAAAPLQEEILVRVSSLNRVKYVAPKYPRVAQRRNLSGWVDVVFTVTLDGSVTDVEVPNSEPGDMFVNAAVRAVEKWVFEPIIDNGTVVEKKAGVRMLFAFE